MSLDELRATTRFPNPVRHLRRLYPDLRNPEVPWGLVKRGNQIIGVYSQSDAAPLRRSGFTPGLEVFTGVGQYSGWRFLFRPARRRRRRDHPKSSPPANKP